MKSVGFFETDCQQTSRALCIHLKCLTRGTAYVFCWVINNSIILINEVSLWRRSKINKVKDSWEERKGWVFLNADDKLRLRLTVIRKTPNEREFVCEVNSWIMKSRHSSYPLETSCSPSSASTGTAMLSCSVLAMKTRIAFLFLFKSVVKSLWRSYYQ